MGEITVHQATGNSTVGTHDKGAIGWIKDSTKSFEMGVYFLAGCAFTSAAITYFAKRATGAVAQVKAES